MIQFKKAGLGRFVRVWHNYPGPRVEIIKHPWAVSLWPGRRVSRLWYLAAGSGVEDTYPPCALNMVLKNTRILALRYFPSINATDQLLVFYYVWDIYYRSAWTQYLDQIRLCWNQYWYYAYNVLGWNTLMHIGAYTDACCIPYVLLYLVL